MTHDSSELARLRDAVQAGERQRTHDRAVIAALQAELGDHRRETRHRIHDILSIMRAIARRTAEEGETAELYQARLDSRLASFAHLQGQLARMPRGGIDLYTMIDGELLAFGIGLGGQARAVGAPIELRAKSAGILGLAVHELARMAIEGGASAGLDGRIDVRWSLRPDDGKVPHLEIVWVETGRQPSDGLRPDPAFGREIVERAVACDVGGKVQFDIAPDGLTCRFLIPVDCPG